MNHQVQGWFRHVAIALIAVVLGVTIPVGLYAAGGGFDGIKGQYRASAVLTSISGLGAQSRVTMAGVQVGTVQSTMRRGERVVVEFSVDEDHAPLRANTLARLRQRTLVGEKYLELLPGRSAEALPDGATLPEAEGTDYVEVDEVLSVLTGRTRERARVALRSLGTTVDGKGVEINRLLENTGNLIVEGRPVVGDLAAERLRLTRLVRNLGDLAGQVGDRGQAIRSLTTDMGRTFRDVARRDDALRASIDRLPRTLEQVRSTSGRLEQTAKVTTPVLNRVADVIDGLQETPALLRTSALKADAMIDELGAAAPRLQETLRSLARVAGPTRAALPKLQRVLCEANPLVRYIAPYDRELVSMISGLGSAVNAYDANGHIARLYVGAGANSVIGGTPDDVVRAQNDLISSGFLGDFRLLGYEPYPRPGTANDTSIGRNVTGPADYERRYTRVQADC